MCSDDTKSHSTAILLGIDKLAANFDFVFVPILSFKCNKLTHFLAMIVLIREVFISSYEKLYNLLLLEDQVTDSK